MADKMYHGRFWQACFSSIMERSDEAVFVELCR